MGCTNKTISAGRLGLVAFRDRDWRALVVVRGREVPVVLVGRATPGQVLVDALASIRVPFGVV
jgi:hypothetical protein